MLGNWLRIYRAAGVAPGQRVYFAFSFGPFLGFWTAFEAATKLGCLCIPAADSERPRACVH
jgi:phenylacetate-CoA ligase